MTNQCKRLLSAFLAFVMLFSMLPVPARAAETEDHIHTEESAVFTEEDVVFEIVEESEITETPAEIVSEIAETPVEETIPETTAPPVSQALTDLQAVIDDILNWYLGTTEMAAADVAAAVNAMEQDIYWNALAEVDDFENSDAVLHLTDEEIRWLAENNATFSEFGSALYARRANDRSFDFLAVTNTLLDGAVTVTDSSGTGTESGGTVTITVKGGLISAKTNNVTITNTSGNAATLSFDYSVSNYKEHTLPAASGRYSSLLQAGGTYQFSFTASGGYKTATLTLSNFSLVEAATTSDVTIEYDSALGSVTAAGSAVSSGATVTGVSLTDGVALVASPASGATFLGWIDKSTRERLSTAASYTYTPAGDSTVIAAFAKADAKAWFSVGTKYYDDLNVAANTAVSGGGTVILAANGTLPAGGYTIPAGVTLLIPYNDANTLCTQKPTTVTSGTSFINLEAEAYSKPSVYRTLNMASGANITINGAMSLSGKSSAKQTYNGCPYGPLSFVNMASGSNITVNNGAFLYAWGYITGSGSVTVKNGGTVYEDFQVTDWRGGTAASGMLDAEQKVFPVSQYYVQNVEVPMTLEAGAKEFCYMSLVASKVHGETTVPFIGGSGMFQNSGTITKDYDEGTDRLVVSVDGDFTMSNLNLEVSAYKMNSANYVLPITNNLSVTVNSGTTTIGQDMCMLPGSEIIVAEGATVELASGVNFYVYDLDEWEGKLFVYSSKDVSPLKYVGCKKGAPVGRTLADAKIVVNGTVDASKGYAYTTTGGASITGSATAKGITGAAGTKTVTYQYVQSGDGFTEVAITPAKLKNADGVEPAYTSTSDGAGTYEYYNGKWCKHSYNSVVTNPNCTTGGYTTYTCSGCGKSYKADETAATGHNYTSVVTPPTCTAAGYTTYTCSGCGDSYTSDETEATGHTSADTDAWKSDVTGHWHTCTTCGGQDKFAGHTSSGPATSSSPETCSICGYVISPAVTEDVFSLYGSSIVIGDGLDIYFYIRSSDLDGEDYRAEIVRVRNGVTETADPIPYSEWTKSGNYMRFCYSDIAAKEMTDVIHVTIYKGDVRVSNQCSESVQGYAMRTLNHPGNADNAELKTTLVDMLNYGAAAQDYFKYSTSNLATKELTDAQKLLATADREYKNSSSGDAFSGSVSAENKLVFTFYFYDISNVDHATVSYTNHRGASKGFETSSFRSNSTTTGQTVYGVDVTGLAIADGHQSVTCTLTYKDGSTKVVSSNVESYVSTQSSTSHSVFKMLMRFVDSAYAYFH